LEHQARTPNAQRQNAKPQLVQTTRGTCFGFKEGASFKLSLYDARAGLHWLIAVAGRQIRACGALVSSLEVL
jgi:hypothetical protein